MRKYAFAGQNTQQKNHPKSIKHKVPPVNYVQIVQEIVLISLNDINFEQDEINLLCTACKILYKAIALKK